MTVASVLLVAQSDTQPAARATAGRRKQQSARGSVSSLQPTPKRTRLLDLNARRTETGRLGVALHRKRVFVIDACLLLGGELDRLDWVMARPSLVAVVPAFLAAAVFVGDARAETLPRFSAPVEAFVGRAPWRLVAADLNADGKPDLATADNGSRSGVSVLLGHGNGSFRARVAYRTSAKPADIAAADLSGDGKLDLITASVDRGGSVAVLLNDGAGRFHRDQAYLSGATAPAVATADVNGDGLVDVLTANIGRRDLGVLLGLGGGRLGGARLIGGGDGAVDLDVGDLNGDGKIDVALATAYHGDAVAVRLGNGDGTFGPKQTYKAGADPDGVALADLNHDAKLDLAVTNHDGGSVSIFLGRGDGTFGTESRYRMTGGPDAVVVADFDADGNPDIATSATEDAPAVATGRGDGTFRAARSLEWLYGQGGAVADFNLDGRPDLAFADPLIPEASVYLNWTGLPAPPCVVLEFRGERLPTAKRYVHLGGCQLGRVRHRYSRSVRKNRVISPRPRIGSVLPSRSRVDIVVSRGRRHGA
jgi:hypothetical protein